MKTFGKHFALIATVAALALPGAAMAKNMGHHADKGMGYKSDSEASQNFNKEDSEGPMKVKAPKKKVKKTVNLKDGGRFQVNGQAAYLMSDSGWKYSAPDGPYVSETDVTYMVEDGLVLYSLAGEDTYVVNATVKDNNNNGYFDDVDVDMYQK